MGINLGQGLAAFAGGALDRAKEIDKAVADRVKTLKASKPDELLKSRYKKEYEKFDKEQAILAEVTSAGGPNTEPGQMALGGFGTDTNEYRKQLAADPTLYFKMRDAPTAPKYTPTDYNLNGPNTIQRLWASVTGDEKTADKGAVEATAGTATSFRRGVGVAQTAEGKEKMDAWRARLPITTSEKEWEAKRNEHKARVTSAEEKYKDNMDSDEARAVFKALEADGRILTYGRDPTGSTKAPTIKSIFIDDGVEQKIEYTGDTKDTAGGAPGWRLIGTTKQDKGSAGTPAIKSIFLNGKDQKIEYTGNPEDTAGGSTGWRLIGGTKADKAAAEQGPKVGATIEVAKKGTGGQTQKIYYTGSVSDYYDGLQGWTTVGGLSAKPQESFSREKWDLIKDPIYKAIKDGTKIEPNQWKMYKLHILENKDALSQYISAEMAELDSLAKVGLEYPSLSLKMGDKTVPATLENMRLAADAAKLPLEDIRQMLWTKWQAKQQKAN